MTVGGICLGLILSNLINDGRRRLNGYLPTFASLLSVPKKKFVLKWINELMHEGSELKF